MNGDALATPVRLLPAVIDPSIVFTFSAGGLVATCGGAALRFGPERPARVVVLGNVLGASVGGVVFLALAVGMIR